mgnify:CR=1 FL=1
MPTPIDNLGKNARRRPSVEAVKKFLNAAPKGVVYDTRELVSLINVGINISQQREYLEAYTTLVSNRRVWGHPEAIKKVNGGGK